MKRWLSIHIFYNKDPRPLLTEGVAPLIARLRGENLLRQYFFVRYFEGGLHVRLRLSPATEEAAAPLEQIAVDMLSSYLERRPSLLSPPAKHMPETFSKWYELEYGAERLREVYGPEGLIPYYPNNSLQYIDYTPEYTRYGGEEGITLAEEHFEASSDVALECLCETNAHVRSILLGQAMQLMNLSTSILLEDVRQRRRFLSDYQDHWLNNYQLAEGDTLQQFEERYQRLGAGLRERCADVRRTLAEGRAFSTPVENRWKEEITRLSARLLELWRGRRIFVPEHITSFSTAVPYLLSSYVHMTNNRLGIRLVEEAYLAFLLRRILEDHDGEGARSNDAAIFA